MSIIDLNVPFSTHKTNDWAFAIWEMGRTAESRLRNSAYLELRTVSCDYHEGVLTIRGRVPSYYLKQLAQSILFDLEGVLELNNQLDVVMPGDVGRPNSGPNPIPAIPCRRYV